MIKLLEKIDLENYTLILPSVAVGNVGQLSIDLLISSLNLHKIGSLWNSMFLPICGLDPYNTNSKSSCTAADFYVGSICKMLLLQLRAPSTGNLMEFFEELAKFVQQKKISRVIILTSSYDYECADRSNSKLRYLTLDDSLLKNEKFLNNLQWERHVRKLVTESREEHSIPGGGFANNLYDYLKSMHICCTVLFCYCSEGDNVSDALKLVKGLNEWLNLLELNDKNDIDVKYPPSWEYFFGNPPSSEMY